MQSWSGAGGGYDQDEYAGYVGSAYDAYDAYDEHTPSFQERVKEIYASSSSPAPEKVKMEEYDHTYGSPDYATHSNHAAHYANDQEDEEYYEQEEQMSAPHLAQNPLPSPFLRQSRSSHIPLNQRQSYTPLHSPLSPAASEEMLVLDRYAGGLEYGFEPGFGLGGSAGTRLMGVGMSQGASRKSVDVSQLYGVDFSDVPIIGQRVRVWEGERSVRGKGYEMAIAREKMEKDGTTTTSESSIRFGLYDTTNWLSNSNGDRNTSSKGQALHIRALISKHSGSDSHK
jgi:hypothetical protein